MRGIFDATLPCILTNEYQRPTENRRALLGEHTGHEDGHLQGVLARLQLPEPRETAGEVLVERVETRQLRERDPIVEDRIGLAAEHLDRVAEIGERLGEMARVHALSADMGLATVGQIRDLERRVRIETGVRHRCEDIGVALPPGNRCR